MKTNTEPREIPSFRIWSAEYESFVQPGESLDSEKIFQEDYNDFILKLVPRLGYIIQQFTGVLDKNKNKIFEGDIVRCLTDGAEYISEIQPIHGGAYWLRGRMINDKINPNGKISFPLLQTYSAELEIIGNIFQNSDLLN